MIAYLSGPIENAHNDGANWRKDITHWLKQNLNHHVLLKTYLFLNYLILEF